MHGARHKMSSLGRGRRPEGQGITPASYYDAKEAKKYDGSSRMKHIQNEITNRAIELLALPAGKACYLLDIGCGSGLSGVALEKAGHYWVGCDISGSMLEVAHRRATDSMEKGDDDEEDEDEDEKKKGGTDIGLAASARGGKVSSSRDVGGDDDEYAEDEEYDDGDDEGDGQEEEDEDDDEEDEGTSQGDLLQVDMGQGLPFRPGSFDGAVSVSALQWLCYSDASEQDPKLRLNRFFSTLYSVLKRDARAVLQFYPETAEQAVLIVQAASRVGFAGGLVVDYPNSSKAKKYYLCLSFERTYRIPTALGTTAAAGAASSSSANRHRGGVDFLARDTGGSKEARKNKRAAGGAKGKKSAKGVDWIMMKKERQIRQGKTVKKDSKYTGRKRSVGF